MRPTCSALFVMAMLSLTGPGVGARAPLAGPMESKVRQTALQAADLEIIGQIGGASHALAFQAPYIYIGIGPRLAVVDAKDPRAPQTVGETAPLPEVVVGIAVAGNHAFVAGSDRSLFVVDISVPSTPIVVSSLQTRERARDLAVSGNLAYVAAGKSGLQVIDVRNPRSPTVIGEVDTPGTASSVAVSGGHAYVADYDFGLQVVDVANPNAPRIVGSNTAMDVGLDVAVAGDWVYVAGEDEASDEALLVFDVRDPIAPEMVHVLSTDGALEPGEYFYIAALAISGAYAYAVNQAGGLLVIDIGVPDQPRIVGAAKVAGKDYGAGGVVGWFGADVTVADGIGYIAGFDGGVVVADVHAPEAPVRLAEIEPVSRPSAFVVDNGFVYSVDSINGLQVFDITEPAKPRLVGATDEILVEPQTTNVLPDEDGALSARTWTLNSRVTPRALSRANSMCIVDGQLLAVSAGHAYVANGSGGFHIVDVGRPDEPRVVSYLSSQRGSSRDVVVDRGYAYVAEGYAGLMLIDVSDPATPRMTGRVEVSAHCANSVAVAGSHAFVIDGPGLHVLDVGDPTAPRKVSGLDIASWADLVVVEGNHAYVTGPNPGEGGGKLHIVDVNDPTAPRTVGGLAIMDTALDIVVSGRYALVGGSGLQVIDVGKPDAPRFIRSVAIAGGAWSIAVDGNYAFVGAGEGGFVILGPKSTVPTPSPAPTDPRPTPAATSTGSSAGFPGNGRIAYLPVAITEHCPPIDIFADVALVLDASTSMDERSPQGQRKIDRAVDAAHRLIDGLRLEQGQDQVALVAFNESAEVRSTLTSDRAQLDRALANITVRGQSRVELGIYRATLELMSSRHDARGGNTRAIVVLSDGMANPVPGSEAVKAAQDAKDLGVLVYVVGVGPTMDRAVLGALASRSDYFWPTPDADWLPKVFGELVVHIACPKEIWWGRR